MDREAGGLKRNEMQKIIRHINLEKEEPPKLHSYLVQTVPSEEITLTELAEYRKDDNIEVQFNEETAHVIKRVY